MNLLMVVMLLAGAWALTKLNTQFFPTFELDFITVTTKWTGASAEDIERTITGPLEQDLRNADGLKEMTSTSAEGVSSIVLEFEEDTDIGLAVDQVKETVDLVRNLPASAETPEITRIVRYEPVARVMLTSSGDFRELRAMAHRYERELLERGIAKISVTGLPEEEIAVQVPTAVLQELGLSLEEIGRRLASTSRDVPVGVMGREETARQLRFLDQRRNVLAFEDVPIVADQEGRLVTLGNIATIERRPRDRQVRVTHRDRPAVELRLLRAEGSDSLEAARILETWLAETRTQLPAGVELFVYDQQWELIEQRINLLLENGLSGLALVLIILFLFLDARAATWVAAGIPVSFMAALAALYLVGGSIDMISLFAFIMVLGIIVDDAIVVGEDAMTHFQQGEPPLAAVEGGARRMLAPVMSSSLTTIAAFLPLMLVGDIIGAIMRAIPTVVICVIVASLIESFLILPGHLRHAFAQSGDYRPRYIRRRLDAGFRWFRERVFRPLVRAALVYRWTTVATAVALMATSAGLLASGRMPFTFFPTPDGRTLFANVEFVSGTPQARVEAHLAHVEQALWEAQAALGEDIIVAVVVRHGITETASEQEGRRGDQFGSILVELVEPDARSARNSEFISAWRAHIADVPGVENLSIFERRAGPPGRDIDIRISGDSAAAVKAAAIDLKEQLRTLEAVSGIEDDTPFGREQLVLRLTATGEALGLSVDDVGRQLRAAYDGYLAQIFPDGEDEIEVRVVLPDTERNVPGGFDKVDIVMPDGGSVPILDVVTVDSQRGFEALRHADGRLAVTVAADVDPARSNANTILAELARGTLGDLASRHGVEFSLEGRAADQSETLEDMRRGTLLALALIYIILAWVFGSYGWPLIVMTIIPFGIVGAIWGHFAMGLDLTILSLFGFVGLSGIVVNDSIILVVFYRNLRAGGMSAQEALVEAACQRLRAVLLTSLTTIAGLTPLLFETSLQAQFLIPMATSIAFGLGFATLLVLLLVPSLLCIYENTLERLRRRDAVEKLVAGQIDAS